VVGALCGNEHKIAAAHRVVLAVDHHRPAALDDVTQLLKRFVSDGIARAARSK
jgi:hypothetical protein